MLFPLEESPPASKMFLLIEIGASLPRAGRARLTVIVPVMLLPVLRIRLMFEEVEMYFLLSPL
jgi:hypothetical protein